ncbi:hypothetical protein RBB50_005040 [Rhinocladiella similis]
MDAWSVFEESPQNATEPQEQAKLQPTIDKGNDIREKLPRSLEDIVREIRYEYVFEFAKFDGVSCDMTAADIFAERWRPVLHKALQLLGLRESEQTTLDAEDILLGCSREGKYDDGRILNCTGLET